MEEAPLDPEATYRLEFDGASRRNPGHAGYGYALILEGDGGGSGSGSGESGGGSGESGSGGHEAPPRLVLSGAGALPHGVTNNEAEYCALLYGLRAAHEAGARRLVVQGDSQLVLSQLSGSFKTRSSRLAPLLAEAERLRALFDAVGARHVPRGGNAVADLLANAAIDLLLRLGAAARAPPSGYRRAAAALATAMALPAGEVMRLEAADDFARGAAEIAAVRCGMTVEQVLAAIDADGATAAAATAPASAAALGGAGAGDLDDEDGQQHEEEADAAAAAPPPRGLIDLGLAPAVPRPLLAVSRRYSPAEGLALATLRAKALPVARLLPLAFRPLGEARRVGDGDGGDGGSGAGHEAAVQQHRQQQQQQQQKQQQEPQFQPPPTEAPPAAPMELEALLPRDVARLLRLDDDAAAAAAAAYESAAAAAAAAAADPDATAALPPVSVPIPAEDGATTYVLQFDGASRNNPGRAAWGYALLRGADARLIVGRGCGTLAYGTESLVAEYHGLVNGLEAARAAGVRRLVVEGDSEPLVQQVAARRGASFSTRGGSAKVVQLFLRAARLLEGFDEWELAAVSRARNRLADRLANVAIDFDAVLYGLLRLDLRGAQGIEALLKAMGRFKVTDRVAALIGVSRLPDMVVAVAHRALGQPPSLVLARLEDKAARLGDPNPWLVQEVRAIARAGRVHAASWAAASSVAYDGRNSAARRNVRALQSQLRQQQREGHEGEGEADAVLAAAAAEGAAGEQGQQQPGVVGTAAAGSSAAATAAATAAAPGLPAAAAEAAAAAAAPAAPAAVARTRGVAPPRRRRPSVADLARATLARPGATPPAHAPAAGVVPPAAAAAAARGLHTGSSACGWRPLDPAAAWRQRPECQQQQQQQRAASVASSSLPLQGQAAVAAPRRAVSSSSVGPPAAAISGSMQHAAARTAVRVLASALSRRPR